jgi:hypothetical protein
VRRRNCCRTDLSRPSPETILPFCPGVGVSFKMRKRREIGKNHAKREQRRRSEKPHRASAIPPILTQALDHIRSGFDLAFLDLTSAERQYFQKSHRFLGLLVAFDVLQHDLRLSVLRNDEQPIAQGQTINFGPGMSASKALASATAKSGKTSHIDQPCAH